MTIVVPPETQRDVGVIAGFLHAGNKIEAAQYILDKFQIKKRVRSEADTAEPLLTYLSFLLDRDFYEQAAQILWPPNMYSCEPQATKSVWAAIRNNATVLLQGSSSMSKTYSAGVYFFLDWLRDPEYTTIKVLGPSEDHLQNNLFSHLVNLHKSATITMPGIVGDLFIGLNLRNRRSSISGVVVPLGRRAAGRLQGIKRFPRKKPHRHFGNLSRVRVLLDEFEHIPEGIHKDLDNVVSNISGTEGLKIVGAYNPQNVGGKVYQIAEPPNGWAAFDVEKDFEWESKFGWHVVRLDGERSENVISGRVIYEGLQTREGIQKLAASSGGTTSAGYYTFGRGAYPPQGTVLAVIPPNFTAHLKSSVIWFDTPQNCGAVDSSLEGGDPAVFAAGKWGKATGLMYPPRVGFPDGEKVMFKDARGGSQIRWVVEVSQLITLDKGDTVAMARQIMSTARGLAIPPDWLMLDRTGNGAGVHDLLKDIWAPEVRGINYSESASNQRILEEDATAPNDEYGRVYNEIWFAVRKWAEFGTLKVGLAVSTEALYHQFTTRLYRVVGGKPTVEAKRDWKSRNEGKSPNEADAVTLLVHGVRMASSVIPSMRVDGQLPDESHPFDPAMARCDITNRAGDDLERPEGGVRRQWPPQSRSWSNSEGDDYGIGS